MSEERKEIPAPLVATGISYFVWLSTWCNFQQFHCQAIKYDDGSKEVEIMESGTGHRMRLMNEEVRDLCMFLKKVFGDE